MVLIKRQKSPGKNLLFKNIKNMITIRLRVLAGSHPKENLIEPKSTKGNYLRLGTWTPPPKWIYEANVLHRPACSKKVPPSTTPTTTITVLGPDGFAAGKKATATPKQWLQRAENFFFAQVFGIRCVFAKKKKESIFSQDSSKERGGPGGCLLSSEALYLSGYLHTQQFRFPWTASNRQYFAYT